jgi:hypothetical protein
MSSIIRHRTNPFLNDLELSTRRKKVTISTLGKDDNVLINQTTGEVKGTHVVSYKTVDDSEFVKLFTKNIALTFDLKSAGLKTLNLLVWTIQREAIGRDLVPLNTYTLEDFIEAHQDVIKGFSRPVFMRGLKELENAQIIAKAHQRGFYYINPNFIFNGDRVAFTRVITKRSFTEEDQQELNLEN